MDSLMLIGDSHFDGWTQEDGQGSTLTSRLGYAYHGKLELMNRSYWGYTTRNQKRRFDEYLQEGRKIRLVIIWLGANDACPPGSSFHVPIHEYRDSITSMIDRLLKSDVTTRIVVMTPSPMADAKTVDIFGNERTNELIGTYRQAALTLKEDIDSAQVAFLDVWPLVDDSALARADLMPDGIHFSVDGGKILFDAVVATVKASWPGFEPAGMKGWYPPPAELNGDDEESLLTKVRTEYQGQFAAGSVNEED